MRMMVAHSPPWRGESCAHDGAPQVVLRIAVTARKMWAGEPEQGMDLRSGFALREQVPGDPQIHDAPVGLRKAFENMPSPQAVPVDRGGLFGTGARLCGCRRDTEGRGGRPRWLRRLPDGRQQRLSAGGQTRTGVDEFHPRSVPLRCAPCGLLIGEPGQPSQVTPVGTGQIAAVGTRQQPAGGSRHRRFQGTGAETNPGLQMAGTGLHHHTRVMPVGAHDLHDHRIGAIRFDFRRRAGRTRSIPRSCERAEIGW